jgi:hypothetical protein
MKLRAALGSELGRNGSRRKGMSSPDTQVSTYPNVCVEHDQLIRTSEFELLGAASQQLLDLLRPDFSPLISVGPLRFGRHLFGDRLLGVFLAGNGVFAPKHTREKRHCQRLRQTRTSKLLNSENQEDNAATRWSKGISSVTAAIMGAV